MLKFGAWLLLSHGQGHGSESIDHNGASAGVRHRSKPLEGNEWREAKLGCLSGQPVGERERRKVCGENGGRKAILWSFKELLFHAKLKSHYRDYMPANNVRQISI